LRIVTNEVYITKRKSWGSRIAMLSFLLLIAGAILSFIDPAWIGLPSWVNLLVAYVLVIAGFIGFNVGTYHTLRWGRTDREDLVLKENLTGLDNRYRLYNYIQGLPVLHALLTPHAVYVLETRGINGQTVACQGDRWRRSMKLMDYLRVFSEERLRNPTQDALNGVARLRAALAEYLPEGMAENLRIEPAVVFTGKDVQLSVEDPAVPAVLAKNLRSMIRIQEEPMPPEVYRAVAQHLIDTAGDLEEDEVAPAPLTRKPGSRKRSKRKK
jgi:hypothetical protein